MVIGFLMAFDVPLSPTGKYHIYSQTQLRPSSSQATSTLPVDHDTSWWLLGVSYMGSHVPHSEFPVVASQRPAHTLVNSFGVFHYDTQTLAAWVFHSHLSIDPSFLLEP